MSGTWNTIMKINQSLEKIAKTLTCTSRTRQSHKNDNGIQQRTRFVMTATEISIRYIIWWSPHLSVTYYYFTILRIKLLLDVRRSNVATGLVHWLGPAVFHNMNGNNKCRYSTWQNSSPWETASESSTLSIEDWRNGLKYNQPLFYSQIVTTQAVLLPYTFELLAGDFDRQANTTSVQKWTNLKKNLAVITDVWGVQSRF